MIIVELNGGLGNQLFQYAIGRQLSLYKNVPLGLDITAFDTDPNRTYRLDNFKIRATIATDSEIHRTKYHKLLPPTLSSHLDRVLPIPLRSLWREKKTSTYDPDVTRLSSHVYLSGYWQTPLYHQPNEQKIREEVQVCHSPNAQNQKMLDQISAHESVSLHIRRGDYVSNPLASAFLGALDLSYYRRAIQFMKERLSHLHFFVFSDDVEWVQEKLIIDTPATYVAHNGREQDYEDLRLMSHCKHHIIANSSFSWWGAWLASHPNQQVVAPQKWYRQGRDTSQLIPPTWTRIENNFM